MTARVSEKQSQLGSESPFLLRVFAVCVPSYLAGLAYGIVSYPGIAWLGISEPRVLEWEHVIHLYGLTFFAWGILLFGTVSITCSCLSSWTFLRKPWVRVLLWGACGFTLVVIAQQLYSSSRLTHPSTLEMGDPISLLLTIASSLSLGSSYWLFYAPLGGLALGMNCTQ